MSFERPTVMSGATIKIKPQTIEDAIYITINSVETPDGLRPKEIWINSKNMQAYQWVSALTATLSAQLQASEKIPWETVSALKETFDPLGGYIIPGTSKWCNGIVSHIGHVLEAYFKRLADQPGIPPAE